MMNQFQQAIVAMAIIDAQWGPRDAHGRRRQLTAEELDALADFGWHVPDIRGFASTCINAVRGLWRSREANRIRSMELTSAESS